MFNERIAHTQILNPLARNDFKVIIGKYDINLPFKGTIMDMRFYYKNAL